MRRGYRPVFAHFSADHIKTLTDSIICSILTIGLNQKVNQLMSTPIPLKPIVSPAEQRILAAARREFVEKGFKGARLSSIAERADVNKALIHYYYRSKHKLYKLVITDILHRMWNSMDENLRGLSDHSGADTLVRTVVATYINIFKADPGFPRLFVGELADGGESASGVAEELLSRFGDITARIAEILQREMNAGALRRLNPRHVVLNLMAMCAGSFVMEPLIQSRQERSLGTAIAFNERFYEKRIEAITDMALYGLTAKGGDG
ncbi:MAG: TetR family transcriptional regulator [Chitinivibrionales bacterium]|nr:TetR family transcriptional regulator [Chitinivibrionales bacterium]MBD3356516.1 TetR family transcriptional regulator [Chitinivibrionales bacterium]